MRNGPVPQTRLSPVYTFVAKAAAMCVSLATVYGYAVLPANVRSIFLIPVGFAFTAMFIFAVWRKQNQEQPVGQLFLILALICTSLILHLLYLPSGLCCFLCLMVAQNELLYASSSKPKKQGLGKQF